MNYKLKNKEIIELKQENNYFRFQLEEKNRKGGGSTNKLSKNQKGINSYFNNLNKKIKFGNTVKIPSNGYNKLFEDKLNKNVNNNNSEENNEIDKDERIKNLRFENDRLRKMANENYTLRGKIDEFENIKKDYDSKIEDINKEKMVLQKKLDESNLKNESIINEFVQLKTNFNKINDENYELKQKVEEYENSEEKNKLNECIEQINILEQRIKEKDSQINVLITENNDYKKNNYSLKSEIIQINQKVTFLENQKHKYESEIKAYKETLTNYKSAKNKLEEEKKHFK
jgi:chromosome segregation ATPase